MLCTRELIRLCLASRKIREYLHGLAAPTLALSKYTDFFEGFINTYYEDAKRSYGFYSSSGFNKTELAMSAREEYKKLQITLLEDQKVEKEEVN